MGQYDQKTKTELQEQAERRGLPRSGTRDDLISRLEAADFEHDTARQAQADAPPSAQDDDAQAVDSAVDQDGHEAFSRRSRGAVTDSDGREVGPDGPQPRDDGEDIAARTADSAEQSDDRYRKAFVVAPPPRAHVADYHAPEHDEMHNANKAQMLESALHAGLHPKGSPTFDGHETTPDGSVRLWYSVECVPASSDDDPASTQTPSAEIADQGGSTADPDRAPAGTPKAEQRAPDADRA